MRRCFALVILVFAAWGIATLEAADFPQFRGPNGNGVLEKAQPPLNFDATKQVAWSTKIPGTGWSQPVVVGKKIFLTSAVSDKLERPKDMNDGVKDMRSMPVFGSLGKGPNFEVDWQVIALDLETGKPLWTQSIIKAKPKYSIHPSNTYATETVCADAERVYAFFGATGTVVALDHQGKEIWRQEVGAFPFSNGFGSGSSPTLFDGKLYIASFNESRAFLLAFDAKTGKQLWGQSPTRSGSSWASPFIWKNSKRTEIIACAEKVVTSHDPNTGEELWRFTGIDTGFAPSPASEGDRLYFGASSPFSSSPMACILAGGKGDISSKSGAKSSEFVAWFRTGANIGMASPVVSNGYLYSPTDGLITCYDASSGKQLYKERLPKSRTVTSSALLVDDKILILDETGHATWIKSGSEFEVIGTGYLKDTFWATPALVGDRLLLRGVDAIYCVRGEGK
jgi:outer membrane protein assembly factor BamB